MKEEFLHYLWKFGLYDQEKLKTTDGDDVVILENGIHNMDAGPDFLNAKIRIGSTVWVGNVEIHLRSSDWYKHRHDKDKAYRNVVLHVALEHDKDVDLANGEKIPCLMLRYDPFLHENYDRLLKSQNWIACQPDIKDVNPFIIRMWMHALTTERLQNRAGAIKELLVQNKNNWEESFYQYIARGFGLKVNAQPFEMLAKSLPLKYLAKHKDNKLQLEALLFGQAGFLNDEIDDEYYNQLKSEYSFLSNKFGLKPNQKHLWKFLRLRPGNFPTIRIAQFANLIYKSNSLLSKILDVKNFKELHDLLSVSVGGYWETHYNFGKISKQREKSMGSTMINNIVINVISPFLFCYGECKGDDSLKDRAIEYLESLKPEVNSIIKKWGELNIEADNAFETQALLQLKNEYCSKKKCLYCQVGNKLIKAKNEREKLR